MNDNIYEMYSGKERSLAVVVHAFNLITHEAEADKSLSVCGQSGLQELIRGQASGTKATEKPDIKTQQQKRKVII